MKILRLSNMAGHTSAPLNSFSIFRVKNYKDEHIKYAAFHSTDNALIESIKADTQISNRLDVEDANGNIIKYFNMIRKWANSISKEDLAVMHGHQPGSSIIGVLALFFKRSKIPFVYTVHNSFTNFPFFKRIILFLCFFRVDVITFVSQSAYDSFKIHLSQKLLNKSIVIQNGVDMDRVDTALSHIDSQDIKKNSSFRIVCIGRLASQKNLYFLINVMVKLNNNICLDIYGEGLLRDDLQRMINENNLRDRVTLHGNIPRDDLFKYLKKSDLYVSVANYEGLPMAAMEALAVGKYCLLSDIDSHFEIQRLVPSLNIVARDVSKWILEIESIVNMTDEEREKIGKQNREYVKESLTMNKMQEKYTNIYKKINKNRG